MSLRHAILGALEIMPLTGYELKTQAFDTTIAYFWPVTQQQIYRELEKILELGWVNDELVIQHDKPNRRVYTITEAGKAELAEWLRAPQESPVYRDALFIQLCFAASLPNEEIVSLLGYQRRIHQDKLHELERMDQKLERGSEESPADVPISPRTEALIRLTLDFGLRLQKTYIDWLGESIEAVQKLTPDEQP